MDLLNVYRKAACHCIEFSWQRGKICSDESLIKRQKRGWERRTVIRLEFDWIFKQVIFDGRIRNVTTAGHTLVCYYYVALGWAGISWVGECHLEFLHNSSLRLLLLPATPLDLKSGLSVTTMTPNLKYFMQIHSGVVKNVHHHHVPFREVCWRSYLQPQSVITNQ